MPEDRELGSPPIKSGFSVPDNDPPIGFAPMALTAGAAALIGLILLLLGLLGDCLETLLALLGAALIGAAAVGWTWNRAQVAKRKEELDTLRAEIEEWLATQGDGQ